MCKEMPTREEVEQTLLARHGRALYQKLQQGSVAVCGLGGLGSNVAMLLARAGIGRLHLLDYDRVELSNIHRQQYRMSQIGQYKTEALRELIGEVAPYTEVVTDTVFITNENYVNLLERDEIICEAFDNPEAKAMLVNGVLETFQGKYVVAASGMAGASSGNTIKTRRVGKYFYLCGDETSDVSGVMGLISSRVMLCAAHQAHMILRIVGGEYQP